MQKTSVQRKYLDFLDLGATLPSGMAVAFERFRDELEGHPAVETQSLILALNETRKTLLASRLLMADASQGRPAMLASEIRPGDGVWVKACNRVDTSAMRVSLDLLFLDSDHRVVAALTHVRPGSTCPEVEEAVGVLELAAGTIRLSQTEKGDHVALEPIVTRPAHEPAGARASRS